MKTRPTPTPKPTPLAAGISRACGGFGLVEVLLVLGVATVMAGALYAFVGPTSATAKVKVERDNLRDLSQAVDRSFGLLGSYSGVSTARVLEDHLAPQRMRQDGDLRTAWGTGASVHPYSVNADGDAFVVSYPLAPAEVCARLAAAMATDAYDIRVDSASVYDANGMSPTLAAERCGAHDTASMEFVFHSGLVSGEKVAAPPLVLPPGVPAPPAPPSTPVDIPMPPTPGVDPADPGTPTAPPPAAPPVLLPPPVSPPGTPPVISPPSSPPLPPVPPTTPPGTQCSAPAEGPVSETRPRPCPAGYTGGITERRTGMRSWTCPEAWGDPVASTTWGGWTTHANNCVANCSAPAPTNTPITRPAPVQTRDACPAGNTGSRPQRRTGTEAGMRRTTWTCPGPTSSVADTWTGSYTYGAWTPNGPDTCAPPPGTCGTSCPSGGWYDDAGMCVDHMPMCEGGPPTPPPASFVSGCDFTHNYHGRTGFESPNCAWDPSAYWQDRATVQVGNALDANGRPTLDSTTYRVEMTSVWYGVNCSAAACAINPPYSDGGWDGRSLTRVRVYRRSDNVLLHDKQVETDFSNL